MNISKYEKDYEGTNSKILLYEGNIEKVTVSEKGSHYIMKIFLKEDESLGTLYYVKVIVNQETLESFKTQKLTLRNIILGAREVLWIEENDEVDLMGLIDTDDPLLVNMLPL